MLVAPDAAPEPLDEPEVERLLAAHRPRPDVERARQIFVNRNLRLDGIEMVGFDMDYTLAIYHMRRIEELSFRMTVARLVERKGYPPELHGIDYDHTFVIRGLCIDKQLGNIFKMDRHQHVGRCHHGRRRLGRDERKAIYRNEKIRVGSDRFAWIDTLFELPEAALFADIVDLYEGRGEPIDYTRLYDDIRETIDSVHRDGTLKAELKKDLAHYILKDPDLGPALHKLRSGGKKLFLLTNSYWDYTDAVMKFLFDGLQPEYLSWRNYFDIVIVGAQKPGWFSEPHPFLELDPQGEPLGEATAFEKGRLYQGGNLAAFEQLAGIAGEKILYVGDHIYGDIIRNRKSSLWRTCMIVQEIEEELRHVEKHAEEFARIRQLERLRERLDDAINHHKLELNGLDRRLEDARGAGPGNDATAAEVEEARRVEKGHLEKLRRAHRGALAESQRIDARVQDGYNPHWGLIFKSGGENSRFGEQIEDYACLYTSRVSNFIFYSPMQYFRSPRDQMPHERRNGA